MTRTHEHYRLNRLFTLRMLIRRYVRAGMADSAGECARRLVRVTENRHEKNGISPWQRS